MAIRHIIPAVLRSARKRFLVGLARAFAVFALVFQGALSGLHELDIARDERAHPCRSELHGGAGAGPFLLPIGTAEAHDAHHHEASCAVCRTLSHSRQLSLLASLDAGIPAVDAADQISSGDAPPSTLDVGPTGPRAPPSDLS
ncbi:MAG: hypothetical protein ACREQQ_15510 [Candidatus Binatia bacterium]